MNQNYKNFAASNTKPHKTALTKNQRKSVYNNIRNDASYSLPLIKFSAYQRTFRPADTL